MKIKDLLTDDQIKIIKSREDIIIDIQFLIQEICNEKYWTNEEFASNVGLSKTEMYALFFRENSNPGIKDIAEIFCKLGLKLKIGLEYE